MTDLAFFDAEAEAMGKASPMPWYYMPVVAGAVVVDSNNAIVVGEHGGVRREADAAAIVRAVNSYAATIAMLLAAWDEIERLKAALQAAGGE